MKYHVGQVLYLIPSKSAKATLYPIQVIEELTKKTLNGIEIDYVVQAGPDQTLNMNQVQGEIFESAEVAKESLMQRAISSIEKLVDASVKKSQEWYPNGKIIETKKQIIPTQDYQDNNVIDTAVPVQPSSTKREHAMIDLGNGVIAKVKLPDILNQ